MKASSQFLLMTITFLVGVRGVANAATKTCGVAKPIAVGQYAILNLQESQSFIFRDGYYPVYVLKVDTKQKMAQVTSVLPSRRSGGSTFTYDVSWSSLAVQVENCMGNEAGHFVNYSYTDYRFRNRPVFNMGDQELDSVYANKKGLLTNGAIVDLQQRAQVIDPKPDSLVVMSLGDYYQIGRVNNILKSGRVSVEIRLEEYTYSLQNYRNYSGVLNYLREKLKWSGTNPVEVPSYMTSPEVQCFKKLCRRDGIQFPGKEMETSQDGEPRYKARRVFANGVILVTDYESNGDKDFFWKYKD